MIFATALFFGGGCLLPGVAVLIGKFDQWMFFPLGVSFFLMIPLPCYFETINVTPAVLWARNILFFVLGVFFLGVSVGVIPLLMYTGHMYKLKCSREDAKTRREKEGNLGDLAAWREARRRAQFVAARSIESSPSLRPQLSPLSLEHKSRPGVR
jgi:hypothetical protein